MSPHNKIVTNKVITMDESENEDYVMYSDSDSEPPLSSKSIKPMQPIKSIKPMQPIKSMPVSNYSETETESETESYESEIEKFKPIPKPMPKPISKAKAKTKKFAKESSPVQSPVIPLIKGNRPRGLSIDSETSDYTKKPNFRCGSCKKDFLLDKNQNMIRCAHCGYRILYKLRTRNYISYKTE